MKFKSLIASAAMAAVIALGAGIAQAADNPYASFFASVLQKTGAAPGASATGGASVANPAAPISTGFHYGTATNCGWFFDGSNQWFYIFIGNMDGANTGLGTTYLLYILNNIYGGVGMAPSCSMGHYIGWFVTNSSSGSFNQTESYPYYDPAYNNY